MNNHQLTAIKNALCERYVGPQNFYHQEAIVACNYLFEIHELCKRIAKTQSDPFTVRTSRQNSQPMITSTKAGDAFINFMGQYDSGLLKRVFHQHKFHPLIELFLQKIERFALMNKSGDYLGQITPTINHFFNEIRIESSRLAFKNTSDAWKEALVVNQVVFDKLTLEFLAVRREYYTTRLEFYINPSIHSEQVERHWKHLQDALEIDFGESSLLAGAWSLDHSPSYGYRYSLMLLAGVEFTHDAFNELIIKWQNITNSQGSCYLGRNDHLPYRGSSTGKIELGDIYKKHQLKDASIFMTQTDYLVKLENLKNFGVAIYSDQDPHHSDSE